MVVTARRGAVVAGFAGTAAAEDALVAAADAWQAALPAAFRAPENRADVAAAGDTAALVRAVYMRLLCEGVKCKVLLRRSILLLRATAAAGRRKQARRPGPAATAAARGATFRRGRDLVAEAASEAVVMQAELRAAHARAVAAARAAWRVVEAAGAKVAADAGWLSQVGLEMVLPPVLVGVAEAEILEALAREGGGGSSSSGDEDARDDSAHAATTSASAAVAAAAAAEAKTVRAEVQRYLSFLARAGAHSWEAGHARTLGAIVQRRDWEALGAIERDPGEIARV
ncbi:hypothetical protein HK405_012451, partial [Cladochytrium tenue]